MYDRTADHCLGKKERETITTKINLVPDDDAARLTQIKPNVTEQINVNVNLMSNTGIECLRDHPSQRLMIKYLTIIQIELEFGNAGFEERAKLEYPEKNLSEQGREQATNSAHI